MSAEPTPPPGGWSCTTTRRSSSFPFFSHFHLAPPDEPQVSTCRSRVRRLTRFFQSPRRVVGPAVQAAPAPAGRPGSGSCSPRDGENNREYQICRRNAGDTVAGGLESLGSICSRLGRSPGDATQAALSPAARDARGMRRPPPGRRTPDGSRTPPHCPGEPGEYGPALSLLMNHICGSRRGRAQDAAPRGGFTAEPVPPSEPRHSCTCSTTLLLLRHKPTPNSSQNLCLGLRCTPKKGGRGAGR